MDPQTHHCVAMDASLATSLGLLAAGTFITATLLHGLIIDCFLHNLLW